MPGQPRRLDEDPWLEVAAQVLAGYFVGFLLFLLANTIKAGDDRLVDLGPEETP